MGIFDSFKTQFRSVIEWSNPSPNVLFYRWSENGDEIKNSSKLIINPGQGCLFVYEGKIQAVITDEGIMNLRTDNIPFWTTVKSFMQAFESEHKVGIYFFRTAKVLNQKWGTQSVIKYEDPKYKFPVGLKGFGNYSFVIKDPYNFFVNIVASKEIILADEVRSIIVSRLVQPLTDYLAESKYSYAEIDANREEISAGLFEKLKSEFDKFGFEITDFRIEGTNFDDDTLKRINRIADVSAEAQAAAVAGVNFAQLQQLEAMKEAAKNTGGAGMGMGMGVGIGFGQMAVGSVSNTQQNAEDPSERLRKLKLLLDEGLITQQEFDEKKKEILSKL